MYVRRDYLENLIKRMNDNHQRAITAAMTADRIAEEYRLRFENEKTRFHSMTDVDRAVAEDSRWKEQVGKNVMYDRWATRDAAVLQALLLAVDVDVLRLRKTNDENISATE